MDVDLTVVDTVDSSPNTGLLVITTLLEANNTIDLALFIGIGKYTFGVDGLGVALVGVGAGLQEVAIISSELHWEISSLVKTIATLMVMGVGKDIIGKSTTEMT